MYVLYAMKLLRKYSNDAMLCLTPNLTYALIHEVTVENSENFSCTSYVINALL